MEIMMGLPKKCNFGRVYGRLTTNGEYQICCGNVPSSGNYHTDGKFVDYWKSDKLNNLLTRLRDNLDEINKTWADGHCDYCPHSVINEKLHNGEISISSTGVLTAQNSVFQISSPNEVTNTELRIYHGTGGNFGAQKFFSLAGSDSLDPGGIAFRGYKGGFEGSGNETKLAAGDYVGQITSQAFDPDFGGGTSILSSQIAFRLDPDETIADDTAKGQIEFINNSGTGTNLTVVTMVFDASGRLGVNKTNPTSNLDVTGTAAVSSTMQLGAMSTATRDALVGTANGMVIYNTTTNKFQGYAAGAWVDLH